jgi:microcystin-dependent protein
MTQPYVGEIRLFAFPRTPDGWLPCDGTSLPISQFDALYAVIGTTYGGDSQTFNVPDLRGRVPIGQGQGQGPGRGSSFILGQPGGEDQHTLINSEIPSHSHALMSSTTTATTPTPGTSVHLATASAGNLYAPSANVASYEVMAPCVALAGSSTPHENCMPTLVGNYCIAYIGIFPSA